jgi:hypothetical protein
MCKILCFVLHLLCCVWFVLYCVLLQRQYSKQAGLYCLLQLLLEGMLDLAPAAASSATWALQLG